MNPTAAPRPKTLQYAGRPLVPPTPNELEVGSLLAGRYRLLEQIGQGGTATIWRARHKLIDQDVAVKVLRPEAADNREAVQRLLGEARLAARVRHPSIVAVHDFDVTGGFAWMVMELLEGETLADRCERMGRLPWSSVRRVMLQLCSALQAAHDEGIIHRDVKPENCVCLPDLDNRATIKLVDFGIAAFRRDGKLQTLLPPGIIAGTPAYMAPERLAVVGDERSDVYAAGVVMYELLTGTQPFSGPTEKALLHAHACSPVEPPTKRAPGCCSQAIEAVVLEALAKHPNDRFASMNEMARAIRGTEPSMIVKVRSGTPLVSLRAAGELQSRTTWNEPPPVRRRKKVQTVYRTQAALGGTVPSRGSGVRRAARWFAAAAAGVALLLGVSPLGRTAQAVGVSESESESASETEAVSVPESEAPKRWAFVEGDLPRAVVWPDSLSRRAACVDRH